MTSNLAKSTIQKWQSEGLTPSFDDIVKLNALGLKVERSGDVYNMGAIPRVSFLDDWTLFEPTIGKRIWIDQSRQLLADDFDTQLYFMAWALNCPDDELPKVDDVRKINREVKDFAEKALLKHTTTEVLMAIDYALNGNDSGVGEDITLDERQVKDDVSTPSAKMMSEARQLLAEAMSVGVSPEVKHEVTLPQLEKLVVCLALSKGGPDVLKDLKTQAAGRFYTVAGRIHERLVREKEHGNKQD